MRCPVCNLENPGTAGVCDCGYDFSTGVRNAESNAAASLARDASRTVSLPAQLGLIFSVLGILTALVFLVGKILGLENLNFSAIDIGNSTLDMASSVIYLLIAIVMHALGIVGWLNLKRLRNRGWAWVGPLSLLLPFNCCCLFGLIPAIWGVVVLLNRGVKSSFEIN